MNEEEDECANADEAEQHDDEVEEEGDAREEAGREPVDGAGASEHEGLAAASDS